MTHRHQRIKLTAPMSPGLDGTRVPVRLAEVEGRGKSSPSAPIAAQPGLPEVYPMTSPSRPFTHSKSAPPACTFCLTAFRSQSAGFPGRDQECPLTPLSARRLHDAGRETEIGRPTGRSGR